MTHLAPRHPSTPLAPTLLASALGALLLAFRAIKLEALR